MMSLLIYSSYIPKIQYYKSLNFQTDITEIVVIYLCILISTKLFLTLILSDLHVLRQTFKISKKNHKIVIFIIYNRFNDKIFKPILFKSSQQIYTKYM